MSATDITVKSLMKWPVAVVAESTSLRQVAEALVADEVGALAVMEGSHLIGVIAERDVVRQVAAGVDPEHKRAGDMMSTQPVTVTPEDTVEHAAALMREAAVRHLPVVDRAEVVGFVSIRDVLEAQAESTCC